MKYYTAFALAAVGMFLPCAEIAYSSDTDVHARLHRKSNLQARLELQPKNDRVIVRIIVVPTNNLPSVMEGLDMKTVDPGSITFWADKQSEMPQKTETKEKVVEQKEITMGRTGGCYESDDYITTVSAESFRTCGIYTNPVVLPSGAFIGAYVRSADMAIFKALAAAVLRADRSSFWTFGYAVFPYRPGLHVPVLDDVVLRSNEMRLTKEMITDMLAARARVDAEEAAISRQSEPLKEVDRFRLHLNVAPDMDALMADVVCVNPEPGKDEQRVSVPQRPIHMKTLSDTSWQWQVKAGDRALYESQRTGSTDTAGYSQLGNCPRLEKGQLVGQMVRFSKSPVFPAVEKFFAETKSETATCAVRLKLKLYVPAEDGTPRDAGELVSGWTVVTRQDYQRIRESALARMQEE